MPGANTVTLPAGVTISPGVESVQVGPTGQNVPGMKFNLTLANGSVTSVFVPYTLMRQPDVVSAMFAQRVADIQAVSNLGT